MMQQPCLGHFLVASHASIACPSVEGKCWQKYAIKAAAAATSVDGGNAGPHSSSWGG